MLYLELFLTFFQIGLFGFGGGYAMLSMIQGEVVTGHEWISSSEFTDIVAISQMTPGPIGINSATYVGYTAVVNAGYSHVWGIAGSITATFAVVLPSFILMIAISKFFLKYQTDFPVHRHRFFWERVLFFLSFLIPNQKNAEQPSHHALFLLSSLNLFQKEILFGKGDYRGK